MQENTNLGNTLDGGNVKRIIMPLDVNEKATPELNLVGSDPVVFSFFYTSVCWALILKPVGVFCCSDARLVIMKLPSW